MKLIVIGPSLSGKTTLAKLLRDSTSIPVTEIDEELTRENGGRFPEDNNFKHEVLAPRIIDNVLSQNDIIFFSNTNYFTFDDLVKAKNIGFQIIELSIKLEELKRRNDNRVAYEGYADQSPWLGGMLEYMDEIRDAGLIDKSIDATLSSDHIIKEILDESS